MKFALGSFIVTCTFASLFAVAQTVPSSLPSKWKIHSTVGGTDHDMECTFTQKDKGLTGTCISEGRTIQITGAVEGKAISWAYNSDYEGTSLTVSYSGELTGDTMSGSVAVAPFSIEGSFTAKALK